MISISTSWMGSLPESGLRNWLLRIKNLGFEAVELSYKVSHEQLGEFECLLPEVGLKVSSIHNFCPTPNDEPSPRHASNYYRLSSLEEHERKQGVKWTNIAVDTAKQTGAKVVVIHAGTLDFEDERSPELFKLYVDGQKDTPEFEAEKKRILDLRAEKKGPHIEALDRSLAEICTYAKREGIKIGLETRYYLMEIPNFEEIGYFLDQYDNDVMGYWHDFGHAEMNSRLGVTPHKKFLETYKHRLVGVHIHGIKGRRDHLAPFEGDMDFEQFMPYLTSDIIKVVESKPFASEDLMKEAVKKLS
ncbi:hypothetical protein MNBD_UNCLBAC01-1555 [hydrothermal vent metagenome]|uniref:Xylose isomerase-like TIM barrel domain-containing protein n=1 Tax=hydrothermal vent metagenome TaxID=652676 RepID=A0A3B1E3U8_9ZZZZ